MNKKKKLSEQPPEYIEAYLDGVEAAMKVAKTIFFDFIDKRVDDGVFYCDLDHVRAYKRWFTERMKHNGGFANRHPDKV